MEKEQRINQKPKLSRQAELDIDAQIFTLQSEGSLRNKAYALFAIAGAGLTVEGIANSGLVDTITGLTVLAIVGGLYYKNNEKDLDKIDFLELKREEIEDLDFKSS